MRIAYDPFASSVMIVQQSKLIERQCNADDSSPCYLLKSEYRLAGISNWRWP